MERALLERQLRRDLSDLAREADGEALVARRAERMDEFKRRRQTMVEHSAGLLESILEAPRKKEPAPVICATTGSTLLWVLPVCAEREPGRFVPLELDPGPGQWGSLARACLARVAGELGVDADLAAGPWGRWQGLLLRLPRPEEDVAALAEVVLSELQEQSDVGTDRLACLTVDWTEARELGGTAGEELLQLLVEEVRRDDPVQPELPVEEGEPTELRDYLAHVLRRLLRSRQQTYQGIRRMAPEASTRPSLLDSSL